MLDSGRNPDPTTGRGQPPTALAPDPHRALQYDGELSLDMGMVADRLAGRMLHDFRSYCGADSGLSIGRLAHKIGLIAKEYGITFCILPCGNISGKDRIEALEARRGRVDGRGQLAGPALVDVASFDRHSCARGMFLGGTRLRVLIL